MPVAAHILPPPLRPGERLTREEFMRRWEAMPGLKRAELVEGVVHMPSPISLAHGNQQSMLDYWLGHYAAFTEGCNVCAAGTWLMGKESAPQPDLALFVDPALGGQSSQDGIYGAGAPELVVEVTNTTVTKDLGEKLRLYERSGVREYLTVRPALRQIVWRELHRRKYRDLPPGESGWYHSRAFPGLWLDPTALWAANRKALGAAVQLGTSQPKHAAFVRLLESRRTPRH